MHLPPFYAPLMTNITTYAVSVNFVERRIVPVFLLECFFFGGFTFLVMD